MKFKTSICLSGLFVLGFCFTDCAPTSTTALKIDKGLDDLKTAIESNPTDCAKMAAAIKEPGNEVATGMKEAKQKNEDIPAMTKLKFAGLAATFQKVGQCSKSPEMQQVFQSLAVAAAGR